MADSDNTSSSQYKLQCERGHQFVGSATYIKSNKLCKICKKLKNIEDRIKLAKPLLSKLGQKIIEIIPESNQVRICCDEDYQFLVLATNLLKIKCCPTCLPIKKKERQRASYEDYAKKMGGKFLSEALTDTTKPHFWSCEKNHTFEMAPRSVKEGIWCLECKAQKKADKYQKLITKILNKKKGGCHNLNEIYKLTDLIKITCSKGHAFEIMVTNLLNQQNWCKQCRPSKHPLKELKKIASNRGGQCLGAEEYPTSRQYIPLKCAKGHEWEAMVYQLVRGDWCKKCAHLIKR